MHYHCLHGAWHGGWVWEPLTELLVAAGHTASAPDLPGLGSRANELDQSIDLEDHINAALPDKPGVIVGHSYAGMLVKAIIDRHPHLVSGVILIEAVWPVCSGQSMIDLLSVEAAMKIQRSAEKQGKSQTIPPPQVSQFAVADKRLERTVEHRLSPQPYATFTQKLHWQSEAAPDLYIIASDREPQPYQETASRVATQGAQIVSMLGGHNLMLTNTAQVFDLLANSNASRQDNTVTSQPRILS